MELTQSTPQPARSRIQRTSLAQVLAITHAAVWGLLVFGVILGTAFIAFRTDEIPPFDWRLALDEQHGLAIHYGPVCLQLPGVPQGACADYVPDLHELSLSYSTPDISHGLVSALVPLR